MTCQLRSSANAPRAASIVAPMSSAVWAALYEAGFVSAAHTADDIGATIDAARGAFAELLT